MEVTVINDRLAKQFGENNAKRVDQPPRPRDDGLARSEGRMKDARGIKVVEDRLEPDVEGWEGRRSERDRSMRARKRYGRWRTSVRPGRSRNRAAAGQERQLSRTRHRAWRPTRESPACFALSHRYLGSPSGSTLRRREDVAAHAGPCDPRPRLRRSA